MSSATRTFGYSLNLTPLPTFPRSLDVYLHKTFQLRMTITWNYAMQAKCWGDYPSDASLYYNNDREIGLALARLIKRQAENEVLVIDSESPVVTDGVLMHLAGLLSQLHEVDLQVLWFAGYPGSDFSDFGILLRRFLLQLWRNQDFTLIGENELTALSFEISGCSTPEQYFQLNIAALGARSARAAVLLVLDIQKVGDPSAQRRILRLAELFVVSAASAWRGCVAATAASNGQRRAIRLVAPPAETIDFLSRTRGPKSSVVTSIVPEDERIIKAAPFIHSLIALNQPAQRTVFDYVVRHSSDAEQQVRELLERTTLWQLGDDRVRLTPFHLMSTPGWSEKFVIPPAFTDTIPNGAKILSFQSTDRLLPQLSSLRQIESAAFDATRLVDLFAMAVAQRRSNNAGYLDTVNELVQEIRTGREIYARAGEAASRSLLCYSSQLLLTRAGDFGSPFFDLFEQLTYGYADFLRLTYGAIDLRMYEASRWLTNLGYIYDKVAPSIGRTSASHRQRIFSGAANYLSRLSPDELITWAETRYSEAWQQWDAGYREKSIETFLAAARRMHEGTHRDPLRERTAEIITQELFVLAFTLIPTRTADSATTKFLENMLHGYGSRLSLRDLVAKAGANDVVLDAPEPRARINEDVVIIAPYPDLHMALLAAQSLRRTFRRATKVVLVPLEGDHNLQNYLIGRLNLVIGAPDTPGAIGRFVTAYDQELLRLYQLRLFGSFGGAIHGNMNGNDLYLLTGCGLGGILLAWQSLVDRYAQMLSNEVSPMDDLIRQLLLPPLIAAETKVVTAFIDQLLSKFGRRKEESVRALEQLRASPPDKLDQAVAALDGDVKTILVDVSNGQSITQALDEAMVTLRSRELDLNQLLSFAALAYEYAARIRQTFPAASNQEKRVAIFVESFRNQRSNADMLRQKFLAMRTDDPREMNSAAETLAHSLRNFRQLINELA